MGKFSGCLLASDFDGTLADASGEITSGVREALRYYLAQGGFFTVCTGRTKQGFHKYAPDIINAPVHRPVCVETTAMGASYLAGLAVGFWSSKEDVIKNWAIDKEFHPEMDDKTREDKIKGWKKAVNTTLGWAKD